MAASVPHNDSAEAAIPFSVRFAGGAPNRSSNGPQVFLPQKAIFDGGFSIKRSMNRSPATPGTPKHSCASFNRARKITIGFRFRS
jgi:hypothetical protein